MLLKRNTYIKIAATVVALAAAVALIFSLRNCRGDEAAQLDTVLSPEQSSRIILEQSPHYDPRTLDEYAAAVRDNAAFDIEDYSRMIVAIEAALNRISRELDQLQANDDPADSWNVLHEAALESWPQDVATIFDFLANRAPLTDQQREHIPAINDFIDRCAQQVAEIERTQLGGRSTALRITSQPQQDTAGR